MKELLEDVKPFLAKQEIIDDLYTIITTLESMEIFKNLGLLDMKCKQLFKLCRYSVKLFYYIVSNIINLLFADVVREMFDNWDIVTTFLIDKIGITNKIAVILGQGKIDMISVFLKERGVVSLKDTICSAKKLGDMLLFNNSLVTAEEVSSALCQLDQTQTQNITIALMKNLNFNYIFKNVSSYYHYLSLC